MNDFFLQANHIVKRYAAHTALNDVSISVPRGKVFGLLGPNGAGKTTLIRIINRITAPDSGEVLFDGHTFSADDVMRIGYLPEERGLYKKMKVGEQAIYLAQLKGLPKSEAIVRLKTWFEKFGIMPWWNKKLEELSKGMQQKVQFIITVLHEPPLLIFDEPFSGFDPVNAEMLKNEILALRDKGHTVIFSTHNMASVEEVCDEIALINHSQVVLSGDVHSIKEHFRTGVYEVTSCDATLHNTPNIFTINAHTQHAGLHHYTLSKTADADNSQLFAAVVAQISPRSISEQMPTMQEIFLQTVQPATPPVHHE
ncbi:ABC transporter ATP-binding protein [Prevotellamassilia timonensis]|uniref:ABC transporter ATP-binding protein n=1 Tax=Prevotellamassilia timonensis TaxID=1852370 RepID=UPI0030790892